MCYKRPIVSSYIGNPAWSRRKRLYLLARADRGYSGRFLENGHATKLKDNSDGHKSRGTRETKMRSILATSSRLVLYSLAFYSNITLIKVNRPILRPPSGDTPWWWSSVTPGRVKAGLSVISNLKRAAQTGRSEHPKCGSIISHHGRIGVCQAKLLSLFASS